MFIKYDGTGELKLERCEIKMGEPFVFWPPSMKAWNSTFIDVEKGSFSIIDTEFVDLVVNEGETFISVDISEGKVFTINRCNITRCGCLGKGKVIDVSSSAVGNDDNDYLPLSVTGSTFDSCYGYQGGIFHLTKQRGSIDDCDFVNISASGVGGAFFIDGESMIKLNGSLFNNIHSFIEGGIFYCDGGDTMNSGSLTLEGTDFENAYSRFAGGIYARNVLIIYIYIYYINIIFIILLLFYFFVLFSDNFCILLITFLIFNFLFFFRLLFLLTRALLRMYIAHHTKQE
jgi:hypothetical protein